MAKNKEYRHIFGTSTDYDGEKYILFRFCDGGVIRKEDMEFEFHNIDCPLCLERIRQCKESHKKRRSFLKG